MSHISAKDRKEYRAILVRSLRESNSEIEENKHNLKDHDETQNPDEQGPHSVADDLIVAKIERADGYTALIRRAIAKIDAPGGKDFGVCEDCGQDIHKGRLKHVPHAPLCIACQRRIDGLQSKFGQRVRQISPSFEPQPDLFEPDPTLSATDLD